MAFDLTTFKERLGLPCEFTQEDELLQSLLDESKAAWIRAIGRPKFFDGDTASTFYFHCPNPYSDAVVIPHRPVLEVVNVWIDGAGAFGQNPDGFEDDPLEAGKDYAVETLEESEQNPSILHNMAGTVWPTAPGSIKMTAKVGYTEDGIPEDVIGAMFNAAAILRQTRKAGGQLLESERIGSYSYTLFTGGADVGVEHNDTLQSIRAAVRRYRASVG